MIRNMTLVELIFTSKWNVSKLVMMARPFAAIFVSLKAHMIHSPHMTHNTLISDALTPTRVARPTI